MKKLFLVFALIAYTLGMTCSECDADCRSKFRGPALEKCQIKCLEEYCL